jgi:hypothetical protein
MNCTLFRGQGGASGPIWTYNSGLTGNPITGQFQANAAGSFLTTFLYFYTVPKYGLDYKTFLPELGTSFLVELTHSSGQSISFAASGVSITSSIATIPVTANNDTTYLAGDYAVQFKPLTGAGAPTGALTGDVTTSGNVATVIRAPAGTLTETTLASNVVTSSLTSVGILTGLTVSPASDSTTAVQLQNHAGTTILNVDSTNERVGIGTVTPATTLDVNGVGTFTGIISPAVGTASNSQVIFSPNNSVIFCNLGSNQAGVAWTNGLMVNSGQGYTWGYTPALSSVDTGLFRLSPGVATVGNGTVGDHSGTFIAASIGIGTTSPATTLDVNGLIKTAGYTVATLPTGVTGARAYCTDLLAPTFFATAVGGGAITGPVFYNGSAWVCG